MKINLENIHSPCMNCIMRGHSYSPDDNLCQSCEYNISIQMLKEILKQNDYCNLCKYVERIKGGYTDCSVGREGWRDCQNYTIDWNAVAKEYLEKE